MDIKVLEGQIESGVSKSASLVNWSGGWRMKDGWLAGCFIVYLIQNISNGNSKLSLNEKVHRRVKTQGANLDVRFDAKYNFKIF